MGWRVGDRVEFDRWSNQHGDSLGGDFGTVVEIHKGLICVAWDRGGEVDEFTKRGRTIGADYMTIKRLPRPTHQPPRAKAFHHLAQAAKARLDALELEKLGFLYGRRKSVKEAKFHLDRLGTIKAWNHGKYEPMLMF